VPLRGWPGAVKKTKVHPKASIQEQDAFLNQIKQLEAAGYQLAYADEVGCAATMPRTHAYAPVGQRANGLVDWGAKGRTNAIGACVNGQLITATEFNCTIDTEVFYWWVAHDLIPSLQQKTALIIDNATFHRHPKIRERLEHHGHQLVFLPKYSPHLNPIEHIWHELKALIRRHGLSLLEALYQKLCN
jgi:transposase